MANKKAGEQTSPKVAKIAAHVLSTGTATKKEAMTLAGAALTQAPNRPARGLGAALMRAAVPKGKK